MPDETKPNGTPPEAPQPSDKAAAEAKSPSSPPSTPAQAAKPPAAGATTPAPTAGVRPPAPAKPAGPTPTPWENEFTQSLKKVYTSGIRETCTYLGQNYIVVEPKLLTEILTLMRDDEGFD